MLKNMKVLPKLPNLPNLVKTLLLILVLISGCSISVYAEFISYLDASLKNETDYNVQNVKLSVSKKGSLLEILNQQVAPGQSQAIANFGMNFAGQLSQDLSISIHDSSSNKIGTCNIHIGVGSFFAKPDFTGSVCKLVDPKTADHLQVNPRYEIVDFVYKVTYTISKERNFSRIFVFGDSLSDNGNLYQRSVALSLIFPISPILPISPPYFEGRFTNGKVWVEHLSEKLNIPSSSLLNYAFAGASVEKDMLPVPNLSKQINTYLNWNRSGDPYALYIVWIGSNDFVRHLDKADSELIKIVLDGNESSIRRLILNGAKHILAPKLPDISLVPESYDRDATNGNNTYSARVEQLVKNYNIAYEQALNKLSEEFPDVNIMTFDVYNFMRNTKARANEYGFTKVKERCNLNTYWANELEVCDKPEEYVFWDGMHPSAKAHGILSGLIFDMIVKNNYKPNNKLTRLKALADEVVIRNRAAIKSLHKDLSDFNNGMLGSEYSGSGAAAVRGNFYGHFDGLRAVVDQGIPLY